MTNDLSNGGGTNGYTGLGADCVLTCSTGYLIINYPLAFLTSAFISSNFSLMVLISSSLCLCAFSAAYCIISLFPIILFLNVYYLLSFNLAASSVSYIF